jgi:hypothetical protein
LFDLLKLLIDRVLLDDGRLGLLGLSAEESHCGRIRMTTRFSSRRAKLLGIARSLISSTSGWSS